MTKTFCVHCGCETKEKRLFGKCECYSCRCAKKYAKKGNHASSTAQVKGLKKIDEQGINFLTKLFVK
jgi:hypothetical protein